MPSRPPRFGDREAANHAAQVRQFSGTPPTPASPAQEAIIAFMDDESLDAFRQVLDRHPMLAGPDFLGTLEQFVAEQIPADEQPAYRQRPPGQLCLLITPKSNP